MPRARDDLWRRRLADKLNVSKNRQHMAVLRRHWPMPHHAKMIAVACERFGLNANDKKDRDILLGMLVEIIFREPGGGALGWEARKLKAPSGRHKKWDEKMLRLFRRDIAAMMDERGQFDPYMAVRKIRQRLKEPKKSRPLNLDYSAYEDSTLEAYIKRQLSPPKKSE